MWIRWIQIRNQTWIRNTGINSIKARQRDEGEEGYKNLGKVGR
jgi:hypothetical protein